jgi:DNA-binding LacI/PurR family transcriptional regulator
LALRTGQSDIVLLAFPAWPHGPIVVEAFDTSVGALRDRGYIPLVHFDQPNADGTLSETCRRIQPVGLVAPGHLLDRDFVRTARANRTRGVVAIDVRPLGHVPTVVVVQADIGRVALEHLVGQGHRRIVALMPAGEPVQDLVRGRLEGARQVAREAGARLTVVHSALDPDATADALSAALTGRSSPTAIYAFNDDYAFAAVSVLLDRGIRIPDDVAVLGCDDVPMAALARPPLTTVRVDGAAFGTALAETLHTAIVGDRPVPSFNILAPTVVVRASA